jgi:hypothetical protein
MRGAAAVSVTRVTRPAAAAVAVLVPCCCVEGDHIMEAVPVNQRMTCGDVTCAGWGVGCYVG